MYTSYKILSRIDSSLYVTFHVFNINEIMNKKYKYLK